MTASMDLETQLGEALRSAADAVRPPVDELVRVGGQRGAALRRRRSRYGVALAGGVGVGAAAIFAVVPRLGADPVTSGALTPPTPTTATCAGAVRTGPLPAWASGGFSDPGAGGTPYVLGARGNIAAILFARLSAPEAKDHANKILWVSRREQVPLQPLKIQAELQHGPDWLGPVITVRREVAGGPGPSYLDLPSPGCWKLSLSWDNGRQQDTMELSYVSP